MNLEQAIDRIFEIDDLMRQFFHNSTLLLSIADDKGYLIYVNDAWSTALGRTKQEIQGTPFLDLVHPDDIERTLTAYNEGNQDEGEVIGFKNRYRHKEGHYIGIEWFAATPSADRRHWFNICLAHKNLSGYG